MRRNSPLAAKESRRKASARATCAGTQIGQESWAQTAADACFSIRQTWHCRTLARLLPAPKAETPTHTRTPQIMNVIAAATDTSRYAKCVEVSKRIRWEIERDVIRGRNFDYRQKFLPDGLSRLDRADFLSRDEKWLMSQ